jgi:signal transduction histidine kinase
VRQISSILSNHYADDPFFVARVKLTGWYLLVVVGLIGFFTYLTFDAREAAYFRVYSVVEGGGAEEQTVALQSQWEELNREFRLRVLVFDGILIVVFSWLAWKLSGKTLSSIQAMVEELDAFAGNVSHGLRTPLSTMRLGVDALSTSIPESNTTARKTVKLLAGEAEYMRRLIEGLLQLVRANKASLAQQFTQYDLAEVLLKEVDEVRPFAKAKSIQLKVKCPKKMMLWGNRDYMHQVVGVLVDNAVKYSPHKAQVKVTLHHDKSAVRLNVEDEGVGIAAAEQDKIFDRFYRSHLVREKTSMRGTGLGLAIAKRLVEVHGGDMGVKSRPGKGAHFWVSLPSSS